MPHFQSGCGPTFPLSLDDAVKDTHEIKLHLSFPAA